MVVGAAREIPSGLDVFDEFAWRMLATGLPLVRVTLHSGTLHPQFLGITIIWWRTSGQSELTLIAHEITDLIHYEDNPVQRVCIGGETLRRRLDVPDETLDFAVLRELKDRHATDYLALPIHSDHGRNHYYMVTYVTDRFGGFTAEEIARRSTAPRKIPSPAMATNS
jgi:adenylate cyclase